MSTSEHRGTLEAVETETGRMFRAVCSCGWTSVLRTGNHCMGNHRRHVAAIRRHATAKKEA